MNRIWFSFKFEKLRADNVKDLHHAWKPRESHAQIDQTRV